MENKYGKVFEDMVFIDRSMEEKVIDHISKSFAKIFESALECSQIEIKKDNSKNDLSISLYVDDLNEHVKTVYLSEYIQSHLDIYKIDGSYKELLAEFSSALKSNAEKIDRELTERHDQQVDSEPLCGPDVMKTVEAVNKLKTERDKLLDQAVSNFSESELAIEENIKATCYRLIDAGWRPTNDN